PPSVAAAAATATTARRPAMRLRMNMAYLLGVVPRVLRGAVRMGDQPVISRWSVVSVAAEEAMPLLVPAAVVLVAAGSPVATGRGGRGRRLGRGGGAGPGRG